MSDAAFHQLALLQSGFVARGAIALGLFYADPNFIYGPALNRTVGLEKAARYPRVVLDEAAVGEARRGLEQIGGGSGEAPERRALVIDSSGVVFVNYLASLEFHEDELIDSLHYLKQHRALITTNLSRFAADEAIRAKYDWLASYHDWFLGRLGAQELVAGLYIRTDRSACAFDAFGDDVAGGDRGIA